MAKAVVGLYEDITRAEEAVDDLIRSGVDRERISLIAPRERADRRHDEDLTEQEADEHRAESAGTGAGIGAVLGGGLGLLVGVVAVVATGVGPLLAAGPLVSTLAGAGLGAGAGAIVGALNELGVPEEEARVYQEGVQQGGTLVVAEVADDAAERIAGVMRAHHPIDTREYVRGRELEAAAQATPEPPTLREGRLESPDDAFRRHFEQNYGDRGFDFDTYLPSYRYGYNMASDARYRGRPWEQVEAEARREWESLYHGEWTTHREFIRNGWLGVRHDRPDPGNAPREE
ncbi:MAG: hypothetical protein GX649_04780 [Chloroflexi bacterium]|nr:hypothetical protein [Chloroflexota bacterium]